MKSREGKILTIGDIAEIGKLSPSDATRKIKELEKREFIRKAISNCDDRSKEVSLTDRGRQVLSIEKERRKLWFKHILEPLKERERGFLIDILRKLSFQQEVL